jgi:hypothetical protein
MPKNKLFLNSKLKLDRAKKHIIELNNDIINYVKSKPYRVVIESDPKSPNHLWTLRVRHEVPCHFSAIIGDAIHNMRSALDLLASDLVRANNGNVKNVYFPFANDANSLEDAIEIRKIARAGEDVVNIIRSLKPYKGGNDRLRAIHDLDITDKHKALIPSLHHVGIKNFAMSNHTGGSLIINLRCGPIKDGMVLMSLPPANNVKIGQYFQPSFHITFGEGQPLEGTPLLETLEDFAKIVDEIISTFSTHIANKI